MANFMTDFKPTGGDWLSAIAKILGSGSEYAGSMEKRKQEELFRKALMDYGVKSGELDTAEEQGLSERDLSTPTTTRMQSIKFGERIPSKEEMMRNQGGVDPASVKLQYPTSIEAPFETPEQSQNRLAGLASNKYEGNTSDQLMKLMALKKLNEPKQSTSRTYGAGKDEEADLAESIIKNWFNNPDKDTADEATKATVNWAFQKLNRVGRLGDDVLKARKQVVSEQTASEKEAIFESGFQANDPKGYNKYFTLYINALNKKPEFRTDKEKIAIQYVLSKKAQLGE